MNYQRNNKNFIHSMYSFIKIAIILNLILFIILNINTF